MESIETQEDAHAFILAIFPELTLRRILFAIAGGYHHQVEDVHYPIGLLNVAVYIPVEVRTDGAVSITTLNEVKDVHIQVVVYVSNG